jgi:uncharacterized protein
MVSSFHLISMEQTEFVNAIRDPLTYGTDVHHVTMMQTHISFVILSGNFVYKIKKPVDFGFLDFSTLEKRKHFCEEEIRLNKRLCPEIYLEVVALTKTDEDSGLTINGTGPVVEYAVKMKRFPQDRIMTSLLQEGYVEKEHIDVLSSQLIDFYKRSDGTDEIRSYGSLHSVKKNIDENFEQTRDMIEVTIPKQIYTSIRLACERFFKDHANVFEDRVEKGFIRDCHGDLHSGNIVIKKDKDICIFDCIEFNTRFRYIDVASDIGFLAMDLDYHNHFYLSSYLIQTYVEHSHDTSLFNVLNFYKSYRAYVRGKVVGFQLNDPHIEKEKRDDIIAITKKYYALSQYYAELFSISSETKRPLVFLVSGLTGTGKSTLASKISVDYHAHLINTDVVRKKRAGIDTFERHHDEPNTGLYDPKYVQQTYEEVMKIAEGHLKHGENVVLDATFQQKIHRTMAKNLAKTYNALFIPIVTSCPEKIAKQWLEQRLHQRTASDGRWEIYKAMKKTFEPYDGTGDHITVDMSKESYDDQMEQFEKILAYIKKR